MESPRNREEEGVFSCWGRLKLKLPWTKKRVINSRSSSSSSSGSSTTNLRRQRRVGWDIMGALNVRRNKQTRAAAGFRYDPLSYAQNFDDGCWDDDNEDGLYRGFSSRFAPPNPRISLPDQK